LTKVRFAEALGTLLLLFAAAYGPAFLTGALLTKCHFGFLRLVVTSTGKCDQARRAVLLEAAQPFADGRHGGGEESRGGLAATLLGALDQPQTWL
jgi:hypothetical protein